MELTRNVSSSLIISKRRGWKDCTKIFGVNGLLVSFVPVTWRKRFTGELGTLIKVRHPSLATLLHHSHKINLEAVCALKRIEHAPGEQRTLRRKDQARKDKINEAMQKMQQERERGLSTIEVVQYCRKISTYLTEKSV